MLETIDKEIHNCNLCRDLVEKFPNNQTVYLGKNNNIIILGEAPANNGWRKSGILWHDSNNKLLPSGIVMQKLLDELNLKLEDITFLEAIKCYPRKRNSLKICGRNCRRYLLKQLKALKPKVILVLGDAATRVVLNEKYNHFQEVVGKEFLIEKMIVIPIYHPSPISPKSYKGNISIFKQLKIRRII